MPERRDRAVSATFLRSIRKTPIYCEGKPAYALHVLFAEDADWDGSGYSWRCSRCGERVKVVTP